MARRRPLDVRRILEWADAHYARTGRYPDTTCGWLVDAPGENWFYIDCNLRSGARGLPCGWSLAQLLDELRGKRNVQDLAPHTIEGIVAWADAHHAHTGEWPRYSSGPIFNAAGENWQAVDMALRAGIRGLPGGSSLATLLREERGVRSARRRAPRAPPANWENGRRHVEPDRERMWQEIYRLRAERDNRHLPPFTFEMILTWADAFLACHGEWPTRDDGLIEGTQGETWAAVEAALVHGTRGLPGDWSIAQLLAAHRGVRNVQRLPPLSVEQVLTWADAHRERTGDWPTVLSGPIEASDGDTWQIINGSLHVGRRGLPRGSSLAQLLDEHRGTRRAHNPSPLTIEKILEWADAWHERLGKWPTVSSGSVPESPGDTWNAISSALCHGFRGLRSGVSLAELLAQKRGKRNRAALPPLTQEQILAWADAHYHRHGKWPSQTSGAIPEARGETWAGVSSALADGRRGLPGGSSLPCLLADHRGKRNPAALPPLSEEQILAWADAYYARHGKWPDVTSGGVDEVAGETWGKLDYFLRHGRRGLPAGRTLPQLLAARRGKRNRGQLLPITEEQILAWADAYFGRHGKWPTLKSGAIEDAPGEAWNMVNEFLIAGRRGLPGGSTLFRLLGERRGKHKRQLAPPLTEEQILAWADAYYARHGTWPTLESGPVTDDAGLTWRAIQGALLQGHRGLPGGSSLARLLDRCRRKVPQSAASVSGGAGPSQIAETSNGDGKTATPPRTPRASAASGNRPVRIRPK